MPAAAKSKGTKRAAAAAVVEAEVEDVPAATAATTSSSVTVAASKKAKAAAKKEVVIVTERDPLPAKPALPEGKGFKVSMPGSCGCTQRRQNLSDPFLHPPTPRSCLSTSTASRRL